jgi:hypothetical protein
MRGKQLDGRPQKMAIARATHETSEQRRVDDSTLQRIYDDSVRLSSPVEIHPHHV